LDYVQLYDHDEKVYYVLAEALLSRYYKEDDNYTVIKYIKGSELV